MLTWFQNLRPSGIAALIRPYDEVPVRKSEKTKFSSAGFSVK